MLSGASDFGQKQRFEHHGYDKQQSKNTALSADVHSITQKIRFQAIAGDCWGCIRAIEAEMGWEPALTYVRKKYESGLRPGWIDPYRR